MNLSRDLYLPRALVFEVWTEPGHLSEWYAPGGAMQTTLLDPRPGGFFEFVWRGAGDVAVRESGEFVRVEPPAGFDCTLAHRGSDGEWQSRLSVELVDQGGACRIVLRQQGVPDGTAKANRQEWEARLDRLEEYFTSI